MSLHVRPEIGAVCERFSAVCTSKGLLARVDKEVLLQVGQLGETLAAGRTLEGPLATVDTQVHLERERSGMETG